MIKILHVLTTLDKGGVATMLQSYYQRMNKDCIHFDFLTISSGKEHLYHKAFEDLGCNIQYMPKNYFMRMIFLCKYFFSHKYDAIHTHIEYASVLYILFAKLAGIKTRIAHSHMAFVEYKSFFQRLCIKLLRKSATDFWACSHDAAVCLYGKDISAKSYILTNAIDTDRFTFNPLIRNQIRERYNLGESLVVGFVGRLRKQKNPLFLIDIFYEIVKRCPDSKLMLLGDGPLINEVKAKASNYGINNKIIFVGNVLNANEYYQAFDIYLMPSLWEGLGIVYIEAQAAGLMTYSSTMVPKDVEISSLMRRIDLSVPASEWAEIIVKDIIAHKRDNTKQTIIEAGYDVKENVKNIENKYIELIGNK